MVEMDGMDDGLTCTSGVRLETKSTCSALMDEPESASSLAAFPTIIEETVSFGPVGTMPR